MSVKKVVDLKVGRHTYSISESDQFQDNGNCVQLLTQSKETISWGFRPDPVLSKRAVKQISEFKRVPLPHDRGERISIFWLKLNA